MSKKAKQTVKNQKQFAEDILPMLEELDFDEIKANNLTRLVKETYKNGFWYKLVIEIMGGMVEMVMARVNSATKFERCRRPNPIIYEDSWVYLTKESSRGWDISFKNKFGENGKYYMTSYAFNSYKRNYCVYCDTSIKSNFNGHLLRLKHKENVKKYLEMLETVLKINCDVVKYIYLFLE